ncbi:unnamed protein product [marine sediment metagenome]|uniref:Uncharacterized protein n=1 Tax=marine sediment metagenome TaxID=412755 RepID=X0YGW9_9ZZZZ
MKFTDDGFASWSGDRDIANGFLFSGETAGDGALIRMKAKKGVKALYIDESEVEFLFGTGSKYKIVDIEDGVKIGRRMGAGLRGETIQTRKVITVELQ